MLVGLPQMEAKLNRIAESVLKEGAKFLHDEAQLIMVKAKERTPWVSGRLKDSGAVDEPMIRGNEVDVMLRFGGISAPYAIYVHEDLNDKHPHGQAKFLENSILDSAPYLAGKIGARMTQMWTTI